LNKKANAELSNWPVFNGMRIEVIPCTDKDGLIWIEGDVYGHCCMKAEGNVLKWYVAESFMGIYPELYDQLRVLRHELGETCARLGKNEEFNKYLPELWHNG